MKHGTHLGEALDLPCDRGVLAHWAAFALHSAVRKLELAARTLRARCFVHFCLLRVQSAGAIQINRSVGLSNTLQACRPACVRHIFPFRAARALQIGGCIREPSGRAFLAERFFARVGGVTVNGIRTPALARVKAGAFLLEERMDFRT